jgi:hypothetical protein
MYAMSFKTYGAYRSIYLLMLPKIIHNFFFFHFDFSDEACLRKVLLPLEVKVRAKYK